MNFAK